MLEMNDAAHNAEQYSLYVEQHMDERRQRVEQLNAFVRHRLRLYRQAQEHVQRQTTNRTIEAVALPPPSQDTIVVLPQSSSTLLNAAPSRSNFTESLPTTNRVRLSKHRLASKQLTQTVAAISSTDDSQPSPPLGTWLNPVPPTTEKNLEQRPCSANPLRRSMSETRLSTFALKVLTDSLTDGLAGIENRKRLQATRALFMTVERRQVKEAAVLLKQNKEIQRLVELKEAERLHQEEGLAQRQMSTTNDIQDQAVLDVNSIDAQQLARIRQQRVHEQKRRELERYIRALKTTLRERCSTRGITVPPLCSCHTTVWDADPLTCSKNCSFYRNPAAFATSLHSLLTSCQVTS